MAYREIIEEGNPTLRKISKVVPQVTPHIERLLDDMWDTLIRAEGAGLAAPQIGVLRRVVIVHVENQRFELINPRIIYSEGEQTDAEGCLSIPGKAGLVPRPNKVKVLAMNREGETVEYEGTDFLARAFCHEIDHLDGILYIDKMTEELDLSKDDGELEEAD